MKNLTPAKKDSASLNPVNEIKTGGGARTMDWPDAMRKIKEGKMVKRISWGNKDYCLLKDGWLSIFTNDKFFIWKVNDGDIEGQDWTEVTEPN